MPIFAEIDPNKNANRLKTRVVSRIESPVVSQVVSPPKIVAADPVIERPTVRKIMARGSFSTPSILDALRDEPLSEVSNVVGEAAGSQYVTTVTEKPFSQGELLESWKTFVTGITDAPQLKSALSAREPLLADKWIVEYELDTELQYNRLTLELKPKLLGFLRRQFENDAIEINFSVSEQINHQSNVPYTDQERWNLLVTKFPSLAGLKSKFGLDFEHY